MILLDEDAEPAAFFVQSREQRISLDEVACAEICVAAPLSSTSPAESAKVDTFSASSEPLISAADVAFAVNCEHTTAHTVKYQSKFCISHSFIVSLQLLWKTATKHKVARMVESVDTKDLKSFGI